jgi:antitoxin (DNA-binding transcriptional repressor) of toxin-antitoxin stability system
MRAPFLGWIVPLVVLVGCGSDANPPPPQLVSFLVQVPGEPDVDLLAPADGGVPAVSGAASFKLVFNQLLDGDKIEDATGAMVTPKTDVGSIVWTGAPAGAPAITAATTYDPSGAAGINQPAPKVFITPSPGLPSGAQLQVKLDRSKVVGKKGAPFVGPDTQMVTTQPFSASASVMAGQVVPGDVQLQVTFTNVPAMNAGEHIVLTSGGMPVMTLVTPDPADPRKLTVAPTTWTTGASYTLTVDKDVADLFGVKAAEALSVSFSVRDPNAEAGASDGAAEDAGSADAGIDASAGEDAAADAGAGG